MSKYWTIFLPAALGGVMYYIYNNQGYVSRKIQSVVDPLLRFGHDLVNFIFGI